MREALKVLSIVVVVVGATKQVLVLRGFARELDLTSIRLA